MQIKVENKALKDYIYDKIKVLLDNGEIPVGEKINKFELAERFKVSQTPVNDALNRLVGENYLIQKPRRGFYVREYGIKELCDLFEVRAGLEGVAVYVLCERATDKQIQDITGAFDSFLHLSELSANQKKAYVQADKNFHRGIIHYANNPLILSAAISMGFLNRTYQNGIEKPFPDSFREHMSIIEAIKKRDSIAAKIAIEQHLLNTRNLLYAKLEEENMSDQV